MGAVKSAIVDMVITFVWVALVATQGIQKDAIISAVGLQDVAWLQPVLATFMIFVYVSTFAVIGHLLGGASFNPTGNIAFYTAGLPGDSLLSLAIRVPAQAVGAVGGAMAIMEVIPEQYKHMIGGPSLRVDLLTGIMAEVILTFIVNLVVLLVILKGPSRFLAKTFILSCVTFSVVVAGSKYTGPAMNPAIAFGWAYVYKSHNSWDHFYVYWVSPFVGAVMSAFVFRAIFPPPRPQIQKPKTQKKISKPQYKKPKKA